MAGGVVDARGGARAHLYEYRITSYFVFSCIVGSLGGSLFGYDLGVSGLHPIHSSSLPLFNLYSFNHSIESSTDLISLVFFP